MALLLYVISECSNFPGFFLPLPGVVWNKVHRGIYNRQIGQHPKWGYQVIILKTLHTCTLFRSIYKIGTKISTSQSLPQPIFPEFMTLKCSLPLPAHSNTSNSKWSQKNCLFVSWSLRRMKFTPWEFYGGGGGSWGRHRYLEWVCIFTNFPKELHLCLITIQSLAHLLDS